MAICDVCGNDYDKTFQVVHPSGNYQFDSIECLALKLAPTCHHCHCRILGHGMESGGAVFCCAHCARASGLSQFCDRTGLAA